MKELYERLTESRLMAKTMTLELKTVKFENIQRSMTFSTFIYQHKDILNEAYKLFRGLWPLDHASRLLGIRFNNIRSRGGQHHIPSQEFRDSSEEKLKLK